MPSPAAINIAIHRHDEEKLKIYAKANVDMSDPVALYLLANDVALEAVFPFVLQHTSLTASDLNAANCRSKRGTTAVSKLCASILEHTQDPSSCKRWFDSHEITYPSSLKSDAFQIEHGRHIPHLTSCLLQTACFVAQHSGMLDKFEGAFSKIVSADIARIEETKGLSYRKYAQALLSQMESFDTFSDVVREVADTVIDYPGKRDSLLEHSCKTFTLMAHGKTTLDFARLNQKWHRPGNRVPIELRPYKRLGAWYPLFDPVKSKDGVTFRCLTNAAELEEEGIALDPCVGRGGYTSACQSGETHIVSVREGETPLATIELAVKDGTLSVRQFRGVSNGYAPDKARKAWKEVEGRVQNDSQGRPIGLLPGQLAIESLDEEEKRTGYPSDRRHEYVAKILAHYQTRVVIHQGGRQSKPVPLISEEAWRAYASAE